VNYLNTDYALKREMRLKETLGFPKKPCSHVKICIKLFNRNTVISHISRIFY